jgi:hypothetical protein
MCVSHANAAPRAVVGYQKPANCLGGINRIFRSHDIIHGSSEA